LFSKASCIVAAVFPLALCVSVAFAAEAKSPAPSAKPAPKPLSPEEQARKAAEQQKRVLQLLHEQVEPALPDKPAAPPKQPRELLVFTLSKGASHGMSTMLAAKAFELMGKKTGAFEATISDDPQVFAPDRLKQFDAVMMDNTTGTLFTDDVLKKSLLDFVKGGRGICGIHAATDCFHQWRDYGEMMGGEFGGHPLHQITVKNEDPNSPINAAFKGQGFDMTMETYVFRGAYSRQKLHILLSVDWEKSSQAHADMAKAIETHHQKPRADNDYALSWTREYGQGRVFYTAFGHEQSIFWNPALLRHILAGIQYAMGDLKADATPSAK
jgi:hypothetical protein